MWTGTVGERLLTECIRRDVPRGKVEDGVGDPRFLHMSARARARAQAFVGPTRVSKLPQTDLSHKPFAFPSVLFLIRHEGSFADAWQWRTSRRVRNSWATMSHVVFDSALGCAVQTRSCDHCFSRKIKVRHSVIEATLGTSCNLASSSPYSC